MGETGETKLGFVSHKVAGSHGFSYNKQSVDTELPSFEIGFTAFDVGKPLKIPACRDKLAERILSEEVRVI